MVNKLYIDSSGMAFDMAITIISQISCSIHHMYTFSHLDLRIHRSPRPRTHPSSLPPFFKLYRLPPPPPNFNFSYLRPTKTRSACSLSHHQSTVLPFVYLHKPAPGNASFPTCSKYSNGRYHKCEFGKFYNASIVPAPPFPQRLLHQNRIICHSQHLFRQLQKTLNIHTQKEQICFQSRSVVQSKQARSHRSSKKATLELKQERCDQ